MSLDLDPKEVLQHLHSLGYCNISPELLKEFMRDLKKLIKYDQKKGLVNRQRREEMSHCCHQEKLRADMEANMDYGEEEEQMELPRTYRKPSPNPRPHAPEYCDADSTDGSELSLERNPPDSRAQEATRKENIPPRPPSSFIRPNDVGGRYKPKSDPVALYHYYQGLWSQNPQPGEDPRSRLRWNIRHQMLGKQKPLPTLPRAVSEEKLRSRPEWQS